MFYYMLYGKKTVSNIHTGIFYPKIPLNNYSQCNNIYNKIYFLQDVMRLCKHLPNIVLMERNAFKSFNHMDYMWAIDGKTLLYDRVIQVIQRFDANLTTFSQRAIKC